MPQPSMIQCGVLFVPDALRAATLPRKSLAERVLIIQEELTGPNLRLKTADCFAVCARFMGYSPADSNPRSIISRD